MYYIVRRSAGILMFWNGVFDVSFLSKARGYDRGLAEWLAKKIGGRVMSEDDLRGYYVVKEYNEVGDLVLRDLGAVVLYDSPAHNRVRYMDLEKELS